MHRVSAAVIGLGRIGLPLSVFLASRGIRVKGVEDDSRRLQVLSTGKLESNEPGLESLYARYKDCIELTDLATAVRATHLSFVTVPTPSRPDGALSDDGIQLVLRNIVAASRQSARRHIVTVVSTLTPGASRGPLTGILRSQPDTRVHICYSPVFVALGSVLEGLESPQFVLIGADDEATGDDLSAFYISIGYDASLLARTDLTNAEIAKLTLNAFLATKIAFANSVAEVCEAVPGGCATAVLEVIARDCRIGGRYLRSGAPYGGPCLPRDNQAFVSLASAHGIAPILANAVAESNQSWYLSLLKIVLQRAPRPKSSFGLIGLTYKPNTDYTEDGFGVALARDLIRHGHIVCAHDPGICASQRRLFSAIEYVDDIDELARVSDVCVLTYADTALGDRLRSVQREGSVIEIWRLSKQGAVPISH